MRAQPVGLDFFCCQGGASAGYARSGFRVIGSDKADQSRYPFEFVRGDALEIFWDLIKLYRPTVVFGSPPCQGGTNAQKIRGNSHPRLIAPFRDLCIASGLPYVIENVVPQVGVPDDDPLIDPIMLCGASFGLHTYRHRLFESNLPLASPAHMAHGQQQVKMGRPLREGDFYQAVGNFSGVEYARRDMGVPWMTRDGIRECVPPAYTEHLGRQILEVLP